MFYKLRSEDRRAAAAIFVANGYTVKPAKQKRKGKDGKPTNSWDYGIDVSGSGEEIEAEDDE